MRIKAEKKFPQRKSDNFSGPHKERGSALRGYSDASIAPRMHADVQQMVDNSPRVIQKLKLMDKINQSKSIPEVLNQKKEKKLEENNSTATKAIPAGIKAGMEDRLQENFDDVKIIADSPLAPQLDATALARGNEIHLAPGFGNPDTAEGRAVLEHEIGHIHQQRAGIVKPTGYLDGHAVNDDPNLESSAGHFVSESSEGTGHPTAVSGVVQRLKNKQTQEEVDIKKLTAAEANWILFILQRDNQDLYEATAADTVELFKIAYPQGTDFDYSIFANGSWSDLGTSGSLDSGADQPSGFGSQADAENLFSGVERSAIKHSNTQTIISNTKETVKRTGTDIMSGAGHAMMGGYQRTKSMIKRQPSNYDHILHQERKMVRAVAKDAKCRVDALTESNGKAILKSGANVGFAVLCSAADVLLVPFTGVPVGSLASGGKALLVSGYQVNQAMTEYSAQANSQGHLQEAGTESATETFAQTSSIGANEIISNVADTAFSESAQQATPIIGPLIALGAEMMKFRRQIKSKYAVLEKVALEREQYNKACGIRDMCSRTIKILPDLIESLTESTDEEDQDRIKEYKEFKKCIVNLRDAADEYIQDNSEYESLLG